MKSDNSDNSQEKIRKATELLQTSWWFCFYLIIAPLVIAFLVIIIFTQSGLGIYISLSFSVLTFTFSMLIFYKVYDKYRKKPFFLNKENNLNARIHILFLISIFSLIVTPIFYLISPANIPFTLLPLISYAFLYNIVYYYYNYQPIDFFSLEEREFKHTRNFKLMIRQPYNFIVVVNYVIHIIFLGFTAFTDFSWLFGLINNVLFYILTLSSTKNQINRIKDLISEKKPILKELIVFKRQFVSCIVSLLFIILIQLPFVIIVMFSIAGVHYSSLELISSSFLTVIFILFYLKSRFYINVYHDSKLNLKEIPYKMDNSEEITSIRHIKYQKHNSYVSCILILLITIFSFLVEIPFLNIIVLPFIFILLHYEQKSELCPKKYNRFVVLLNAISILVSIAFGLIPIIPELILLNFLVFCLSLYFVLQIFAKYEYFIKDNILIYQNLLAIASFVLLLYSFFPIAIIEYTTFTSDPVIILISNILLHLIIISVTFLISLYILGVRYFYAKSPKSFRIYIIIISFLVELVIFVFINFRNFIILEFINFLYSICISSILFPIIFLFFLLINYSLQAFKLQYFLTSSYFTFWIFLFDFFISLLIISLINAYLIVLMVDCLITSVFYYYILKFGLELERVNVTKFKRNSKINSYLITIELLSLFFTTFFTAFQALSLLENIIYSLYLSLLIIGGLINLFSKKDIFSEDLYLRVNIFILLYSSIIAFFYFLLLTFNTIYVFIIPLMVCTIILYLPLFYLRKKRVLQKFTLKSLKINSVLFSVTISLIPMIIGLELFYFGNYFDLLFLIVSVINFTFYIVFTLCSFYYYILKKIKASEKRVNFILKLQVLITVGMGITTIFYYPFFLLTGTFYSIIIPFIFMFCFFYIPLFYSYKTTLFKRNFIKKGIVLTTIILTGLFTSIPTIITLNLINLGFLFDFYLLMLNLINFSAYIFYTFLLILNYLFKKLELKDKFILDVGRLQFITMFCISITTVFFYPFLLLFGTFYIIIVPLIALLFSWFFLFYYSYKKEYFNLDLVKKLTIYNFTALSCLIVSLPTIIGLELIRIGFQANLVLIITITLMVLFIFLNISEIVSVKINLKENYINYFKLFEIITWFLFSLLVSYYIASIFLIELDLTPITLLTLSCSFFIFFILSVYTLKLTSAYHPKLTKLNKYQDILIYGIILSISSIFTFLILSTDLFRYLISGPIILKSSMLIGFFTTLFLLLIIICENLIELKLTQVKIICKSTSWIIIKIMMCTLILSLIELYIYQFSVVNKILLLSLIFTFLTPLSLFFLKNSRFISSENKYLMKKITLIAFIISLLGLYIEFLYNLIISISFFYQNSFLQIATLVVNLGVFSYYYFLRFNKIIEEISVLKIYRFYFLSFILFVSLLYYDSILSIFLILISYIIILSQRSIIPIFRFMSYFVLSYITFIEILIIINTFDILIGFEYIFLGVLLMIYFITTISVLFFSIILNMKKNNTLEKFALYSLISLLSFVSLTTFTNILLMYNITISLFIYLLFMGIFFYRQQDERYKWFIKPCVVLFIFDLISFLSYSWFFNNEIFGVYNPILTFTLTMSITGFGFVLLYNDIPGRFRKRSFYIVLGSIIISFPTFTYFLIIASLSMPLVSTVPLIFAINLGVFLFYFCIGIYHWRVSWAIWKSGWYIWNILPFVNFFIIYQSLTGVDVFTNSLQFGVFNIEGSFIISIIICSLFFLPVLYTKIKKYFFQIIFIIWGESLFLLYWVSQNLFVNDLLLRNLSFILFSVILLMPLFAGFKYWKVVSILWLILTIINGSFLFFYLISIGIILEVTISINILVTGLFLITYSFFPNIRSIGIILISAYFTTLIGIFLTVYFILYSIILDTIFSLNISFIIVGLSLFSSKYVKLKNRIIDLSLSWILIFNLAWLTFNTFNMLPGLIVLAFSLALTVLGFSFFIFNRYKMKIPVNIIIPHSIITIGASLSVTSFISIIFKASPGILISAFSSVFIIFLYFLIKEYRYVLWFGFPIPITAPILEIMVRFGIIQPFWLLTWSMLYLITFQILINLFKNYVKEETQEIKNSIFIIYKDKIQLKWFNFICFLLNSINISLFITIILPNLIEQILFSQLLVVYQLCDFLIIWSFLFLFCMKYIEKVELDVKLKNPLLLINRISFLLYILIPLASGINLLLYLFLIKQNFIMIIYSFLLLISGIAFIEGFLLDRSYFYFMFNSLRNEFTLGSWLVFSNTIALVFYLLHSNVFLLLLTISLLNLVSVYFLSYLDISRQKISFTRVLLIYNSFIWISFYIASLISDGLLFLFEELSGIPYYTILFQNSFILLYIFSYFLIKFEVSLKNWIEFILFTVFQGLLAINLIFIFLILNILNFFTINLTIFVEICFIFNTMKICNKILPEQKYPNFLEKIYSILFLFLYCEVSLVTYGLLINYIGFYESVLSSLIVLLILTSLDIYSIQKIKKVYATIVHTFSFFVISLMLLLILNQFIFQYSFFLSLEFFIFLTMQFYTNFSLFIALKLIYPNKMDTLKKLQSSIQHILGAFFYGMLCLFILQGLVLQRIEIQLILLILSCVIHILMILDNTLLKFLGKSTSYIKLISWIFIMIFTTAYLIWIYNTYFLAFLLTVIPIIVIILLIELAYLFRLLSFWLLIASNKEKIRFNLIIISYINFITWPLYFLSLNLLLILNLFFVSFFIMFVISLIDTVLKEKLRKFLRSSSFLISGALLSTDIYLLLTLILDFNILLTLSISSLIFMTFLTIIVKPFKKHSIKAFIFWSIIFLLLSSIIYHVSQSFIFGGIAFGLTILIYPFVFLLEELRELFNQLIDIISKIFRKFKTLIINILLKLSNFIKTHFRGFWIVINIIASIFFGVLFSPAILNLLNPIHSTLIIFPLFGLLYSLIPSKKSEDADIRFKRRMIRLIISWGSIIVVLFVFITPIWYIFTIWISIWIVGAILLPYMIFKEKKENISIKWRFYTLILLIIFLIIFGIIFGIQVSGTLSS